VSNDLSRTEHVTSLTKNLIAITFILVCGLQINLPMLYFPSNPF
jgi:hypothetical protein